MKHLLTIAVAVVLTAPLAAQSAADDSLSLFWLDDGTSGLDLTDDPLVVRQGLLQAEVGALRRLAPPGEYPFEPITSVRFQVVGDPDWIKISIDARTETERGLRLSGSLQDEEYGALVLVVHREGVVAGSVRTADDVFDIKTLRTGEIVVTELDTTQFGPDEPQPPVDASPDGGQTSDFHQSRSWWRTSLTRC